MHLRCGQCGHTFEVDAGQAGATVACPRCEHPVAVADPREPAVPPSAQAAAEGEDFARLAVENISRRLRVACGACGKGLSVALRRAGKRVRCPSCGKWVQIPASDEQDETKLSRWTAGGDKETEALVVSALPEEAPDQAVVEEPPVELTATAETIEQGQDDDVFVIGEAVGREVEQPAESLADLADALQFQPAPPPMAVDYAAPVRRRRRTVRRPGAPLAYLPFVGLAAATAVVALVVWLHVSRRQPAGEAPTQPQAEQASPGLSKSVPPIQPAASRPVPPAPRTEAPLAAAPPAPVEILDASREFFAAEGYYPASPRGVYWRLRVAVRAGKQAVRFDAAEDVELLAGEQRTPSLGLASRAGLVPRRAQAGNVSVAAGSARELTLLFELPIEATPTRLVVHGAGEAAMPAVTSLRPPADEMILGNYREKAPRNLRPLLRDPVMAAIQNTPDQTLVVRAVGAGFDLAILPANLTAEVGALGDGLYGALFRLGENTLKCKLRLIGRGEEMVLYLSDEPFHQITYAREGPDLQAGK